MPNRSQIALVISDIDGTLITSNHEVTEATKTAASELHKRGIALSLASSRPPRSIKPLAEALGLRTGFAAFNGALVVTAGGEVLESSVIPPATTARVKAIADEFGLSVWAYDEADWWAPVRDSFVEREAHTSGFDPRIEGYEDRLTRDLNKIGRAHV